MSQATKPNEENDDQFEIDIQRELVENPDETFLGKKGVEDMNDIELRSAVICDLLLFLSPGNGEGMDEVSVDQLLSNQKNNVAVSSGNLTCLPARERFKCTAMSSNFLALSLQQKN